MHWLSGPQLRAAPSFVQVRETLFADPRAFEIELSMARRAQEKFLILMVDDSADDCLLLKMAVSKTERLHFLGSLSDGDEVIDYLNGAGKYADRDKYPVPDMLLLDLKMPRKDGFEVLSWLKQQPFDDMVVVVLSGSNQPEDVQKALSLGADHYHTKDPNLEGHADLMRALEEYLTGK